MFALNHAGASRFIMVITKAPSTFLLPDGFNTIKLSRQHGSK